MEGGSVLGSPTLEIGSWFYGGCSVLGSPTLEIGSWFYGGC